MDVFSIFRCGCLPGCSQLSYEKSLSLLLPHKNVSPREEFLMNFNSDYLEGNIAVMNFYFKQRKYDGTVQSDLYGFAEFLSQAGGLLSVFLGFSSLSFIEAFYHAFIRILCRKCRRFFSNRRKKSRESNQVKISPLVPSITR